MAMRAGALAQVSPLDRPGQAPRWAATGRLVTGAGHRIRDRKGDAMTDPASPPALATALAYHQAWTSHNLDQAMTYIADGITCDAPGARISGADQYRDFLGGYGRSTCADATAAVRQAPYGTHHRT
jgi:SnoaL-like protein